MDDIEEKRVYGDREGATRAYVSSSIGVVRVRVAGDAVGEFDLCARCTARDVAANRDAVAVATDEDVRLLALEGDDEPDATGFGPAVAVGTDGRDLLAAGPDGRVARRPADGDEWRSVAADLEATVRAIDGDLLATDAGVYRVVDAGLDHAGLTEVRDVAAAGVPLAATDDGLYKLGNGWMEVLEGPFDAVAADPRGEPGRLERAHAVRGETVYEHADGAWHELETVGAPVVDVGYGDAVYAVTEDGTFLAATDDGWRRHSIGVSGVTGLATPLER